MMSIRVVSQYVALILSSTTLVMTVIGLYLRPDSRWIILLAGIYSLIDVCFYVIVLVLGLGALGSEISPYRVAIQDSIVMAFVYRYLRGDFRDWIRSWK